MIALCLACALATSGMAQTNTEYSFRQQSVIDGQAFNNNGDPVPILTMDCLAANGCGQWTLSSSIIGDDTYPPGWYLLTNGLYAPCTHLDPNNTAMYPRCIPPGVVQNGCLFGPPCGAPSVAEPKTTANLNGAISFVWPDRTGANAGSTFAVQGFRSTDIDISLSFLSNPAPPMNITPGINSYPPISTSNGTLHNVVTAIPFQDEFDICCDAAFIYITWCSTTNMSAKVGPSEIWWEVLDINSLAVVAGPTSAGSGMRPTISCDPRNNRTGGPAIHFDLAFIAPVSGNWLTLGGLTGGSLVWEEDNAGTWTNFSPTIPTVLLPAGGTTAYYMATHARALTSSVLGGGWYPACYAIVEGFSGDVLSPVLILYNKLDPQIPPGQAAYVDGDRMPPYGIPLGNPDPTDPLPAPVSPQIGWPVKDAAILAMANPYDNQNISSDVPSDWQAYDQFHCLYQLDLSQNPGQPANEYYPLLIVRNSDNGEVNPPQPKTGSTADTRLVLSQLETTPPPPVPQLLPDPTTYCAAVNQMGIHVHWRVGVAPNGIHYYARDMGQTTAIDHHYSRAFNENIDENTLVTDRCIVSDGSTHGGTVGARVLGGHRLSIWTDPNYGADLSDLTGNSGLYQPETNSLGVVNSYVGQLALNGGNVQLALGETNGNSATLAVMPYFYINFDGSGQSVRIETMSTFDFYGLQALHNTDGSIQESIVSNIPVEHLFTPFRGFAEIDLEGIYISVTCQTCGPIGDYPAYLNIHGGADFTTSSSSSCLLTSTYGRIDILNEPNIYPLTNGVANGLATGHMTLGGQTLLTTTAVYGNIPSSSEPIISVNGNQEVDPQFDAESTSFQNAPTTAAAEIQIEGIVKSFGSVIFNDDYLSAIKIHSLNSEQEGSITGNVTVNECSFQNMHGRTVFIENTFAPTGVGQDFNGQITITNNYFNTISPSLDPDDPDDGTYGIYIKNYDGNWNGGIPGLAGSIVIENNKFIHDNWTAIYPENLGSQTPVNLLNAAAICLENSTGNLLSNTISDPAWTNGIWLKAAAWNGTFPQSNSLLCSNTISELRSHWYSDEGYAYFPLAAIRTEYHTGRSRLNYILDCDTGYSALGYGYSFLAYNTVDNTSLFTTDPSVAGVSTELAISSAPQHGNTIDLSDATSDGGHNLMKATYYYNWALGLVVIGDQAQLDLSGGHNNFYLSKYPYDDPNHPATDDNSYILKGLTGALALGDIDYNFWGFDANGTKIDPANESTNGGGHWNAAQTTQFNATGISFSPSPSNTLTNQDTIWTGIDCDVSYARAGGKSSKPQSVQVDTSCAHSYAEAHLLIYAASEQGVQDDWAAAFNTEMAFVERCPTDPHASFAFGDLTMEVQSGGDGTLPGALLDFRAWLLTALAWNTTNPNYFCSCVNAIAYTFGTSSTDYASENTATNKGLSILYWLDSNPLCTSPYDWQLYNDSRGSQEETWFNTQDTTKVPLDTTKYSLQDLGLDSVLKYAGLLGVHEPSMASIISNATAFPNPTGEGILVSFGVSKEAYVVIRLFDVLGHDVTVSGFGGVVQPGNLSVPLSLQGLSAGTYYARIQTTYGEVQTVKLVKE